MSTSPLRIGDASTLRSAVPGSAIAPEGTSDVGMMTVARSPGVDPRAGRQVAGRDDNRPAIAARRDGVAEQQHGNESQPSGDQAAVPQHESVHGHPASTADPSTR